MQQASDKRWQVLLWPPVADEKYRKVMIWVGCFAAFFYAANWGLTVLVGAGVRFLEHDTAAAQTILVAIPHFLIALVIGWGILKKSRIAASAGLVFSLTGFIASWVTDGLTSKNSAQYFFAAWMLAQSVRAIFAYHRAA